MKKNLLPVSALRGRKPGGQPARALLAGSLLLANLAFGNGNQVQAAPVGAPTTITLQARDKDVAFLLREIERQSDYVFIYSDNRLGKRLRQSVDLVNVPLETALVQVLRPLGVEYRIVGKQIILTTRRGAATAPELPLSGNVVAVAGLAPTPALVAARGEAATRPVSGRVTARDGGGALPGVNVLVKGTSVGTATDAQGNFALEAPEGATTLVFSYVGYAAQEVAIGDKTTFDISLAPDAQTLNDVVVTGFGLTRERRSLGYSVQEIKGSELTEVREPNPLNALAGKLAGVQINRNGSGPAGATNIIIRGYTSLTRDSRPLIVVDGVPIDNSNLQQVGSNGGFDSGDGLSAINPDDIESISVLKGGNAAALYGNRAANGVVIITTKKGSRGKGLGISVNSNTVLDRAQVLTDFQNQYGQGTQGQFLVDANGNNVLTASGVPQINPATELSWGPRMSGQTVRHWTGEEKPFSPQANNIDNFFRTGYTTQNTVALSGGNDKSTVRVSLSDLRNGSTYPNSSLRRDNVGVRATTQLGPKLSADLKANYTNQRVFNRPPSARLQDNPMNTFLYMPRSIYLSDLENYRDANLYPIIWNRPYSVVGTAANGLTNARQNPYWAANLNTNEQQQDRLNGSVALRYDVLPWLWAQVRTGTDVYTNKFQYQYASYTSWNNTVQPDRAVLSQQLSRVRENNTDFILSGTRPITPDLEATVQLFGNVLTRDLDNTTTTATGFAVPNLFSINNGVVKNALYNSSRYQVNSLYGRAQLDYKRFIFLEGTARNDWDSSLPSDSRSYFYYSGSAALGYTDLLKLDSKVLTLGKLRASYARVGKGTNPYEIALGYDSGGLNNSNGSLGDSHLNQPFATQQDNLPPVNLKPQITQSLEFGSEMRFFGDRGGLDVTVYRTNTYNQITSIPISATSGFRSQIINAGNIQNQGLEITALVTPLKTNNFRWDFTANWAANRSKIVALNEGGRSYFLGNDRTVSITASLDEPFGNIVGTTRFKRNGDGNILVGANGLPTVEAQTRPLGNFQPQWFGGVQNNFTYKGITLHTLIDGRWGGQVFSLTQQEAARVGNSKQSLEGREGWYASEAARVAAGVVPANWTPTGGYLVQGVVQNTDGSFSPNARYVNPQAYWTVAYGTAEPFIYDASFIKLREVALSYRLPAAMLSKLPYVRGVSFSLVARNVAFLARKTEGFDPESSYNISRAQGIESGGYPNSRSIGYNLNLEF